MGLWIFWFRSELRSVICHLNDSRFANLLRSHDLNQMIDWDFACHESLFRSRLRSANHLIQIGDLDRNYGAEITNPLIQFGISWIFWFRSGLRNVYLESFDLDRDFREGSRISSDYQIVPSNYSDQTIKCPLSAVMSNLHPCHKQLYLRLQRTYGLIPLWCFLVLFCSLKAPSPQQPSFYAIEHLWDSAKHFCESEAFGKTWRWVNDDRISIVGLTTPLGFIGFMILLLPREWRRAAALRRDFVPTWTDRDGTTLTASATTPSQTAVFPSCVSLRLIKSPSSR